MPLRIRDNYSVLFYALIGFSLFHVAFIIYRIPLPLQIDPNEAWNAWHAASAMGRRSLYPTQDELIINNYPPLSFYIVGLVGRLLGDDILAGRIISLTSTLMIVGLIWLIIRRLGGSAVGASLGALFWVSSTFRFASQYVGSNEPAMLGLAAMLAGLHWYMTRVVTGGGLWPPLAVMVAAGFVKHNMIVLPVLAFVWHAQHRGISASLRFAVLGAAMATASLLVCYMFFGSNFILQLTLPREIRLMRIVEHLNRLQFIIVALVVWGFWIAHRPWDKVTVFTSTWLGLGLVTYCLQKMSPGVDTNAMFEMWVGAAVGFGLAAPAVSPALVSAAVLIRLLADPNIQPYRLVSASFRADVDARVRAMMAEVETVRRGPTPIVCSIPVVCYRAGQPFTYDIYGVTTRLATRQLSRARFDEIFASNSYLFRNSDPYISWYRGRDVAAVSGTTVPLEPPMKR